MRRLDRVVLAWGELALDGRQGVDITSVIHGHPD